jgi:hypothetical protein
MANLTDEWDWYLITTVMVLIGLLLALAVKVIFWGCWVFAPSIILVVSLILPRTLVELKRALARTLKARRAKKPKPPPIVVGGLPQRRKTKATRIPRVRVWGEVGVQQLSAKGEVMRELGLSYARVKDNKRCSEPESLEYTPQGTRLRSHVKMKELIELVERQGEVKIPAKAQIGVHHADSICSLLKAELRRSGKSNIEVINSGGYIIVKERSDRDEATT